MQMDWIRRNKLTSIVISIEIAIVFWALWQNAESVVLELAVLFGTTTEIINALLILQGILVLISLGAIWKLVKR